MSHRSYAIGGAIAAFFYIERGATFDVGIFVLLQNGSSGLITLDPIYGISVVLVIWKTKDLFRSKAGRRNFFSDQRSP